MLRTDDVYKLHPKKLLHMDGHMMKEIAALGFPAAIQSSLISISNLFVQRYINSFGSSAMAGIGAAKKIDRFVGMIAQSLGLATTTFVSQNVGAEKYDEAYRQGYRSHRAALLISMSVCVIGVLLRAQLIGIFTDDPEVIEICSRILFINVILEFGRTTNLVIIACMRGAGAVFFPTLYTKALISFVMCGMTCTVEPRYSPRRSLFSTFQ